MFQTEIILFLQSLAGDGLTACMRLVSRLGDGDVMIPLLMVVMLAVHFRGGFLLLQGWIWAGAINGFLKTILRVPRPVDVDSRVHAMNSTLHNLSPLRAGGAQSFFGFLPAKSLPPAGVATLNGFGFPSGHAACAASWTWLLSRELKNAFWRLLLITWVLLIAFSRIYLGRHFLADILAGTGIGILVGAGIWALSGSSVTQRLWLQRPMLRFRAGRRFLPTMAFFLAGPLILFLVPQIYNSAAARLLGLNLGFLFLWWRGLPRESGSLPQRFLRAVLGMSVFALFHWGLAAMLSAAGIPPPSWFTLLCHFLAPFLTLTIAIPLGIHFGVWQR